MQIISFNVLLRYYEETYKTNSKYLKRFPIEEERVEETIDFLLKLCKSGAIICLQECSKQFMNTMRKKSGEDYTFYSEIVDNNPEENLITLIPKRYGKFVKVDTENKLDGIASGILVLSNSRCVIANCHLVPQKYCKRDVDVLGAVNEEFACSLPTIVAGDFNAMYDKVSKVFGEKFNVPFFCNTYHRTQLDYILISKNSNYDFYKKTVAYNDFSDHNLIKLEVCKYT